MQIPSLLTCLGLAVSVSPLALAQPLTAAGRLTDTRVERDPTDQTAPREGQNFSGEFVTMRDELENFPLDTSFGSPGVSAPPTSFTGPPGFQWPLNNLRGQASTNFVRLVDLSGAPVGGANGVANASRAIEIVTGTAQPPGGFFTGANLRFGGQPGEPTLPLAPTADHNARISAELYISTIDQAFSFEATATFIGFTTGRLYWGGVRCPESEPANCTDIGLPAGLIDTIHSLGDPAGFSTSTFRAVEYCTTREGFPIAGCVPPPGFAVGDEVPPPIANWSRFAAETTSDGRLRFLLDLLDGSGEVVITDQIILTSGFIDRVGANTSFESQDAFMLIDNIEAAGPVWARPKAPPLDCPYIDDMEWLFAGPLTNQNPRWDVPLSSAATVVNDGVQGQVIQQINNVNPNNIYRREISTLLLPSSATVSSDLVATVQVRTTGTTVRGFALFNGFDLAARVLFNYRPTDSIEFDDGVYVQTNPFYQPIDDPFGSDPLANAPVIGADIVDTEYDWDNNGVYRTLEMRLSASGALRVSIDGQRIYAGAGAFLSSIDRFAFESENNAFGANAQLRINDVTLTCDAPSCAADFNLDDIVDFADLNTVLTNFGIVGILPPEYFLGNANGDGAVDFADLNAVLSAFGTTCD
jgi:hypothetical protein